MDNDFDGLSKISLQNVLLNRLSKLSNLRRQARAIAAQLTEIREELRLIKSALAGVEVLPFTRILNALREDAPEVQRRKKTGS